MKLHLPKQLFTALLAAITLTAPAARGANDLNLGNAPGNFYAGNYAFSFRIDENDLDATEDTTDVLALYWGTFDAGEYYTNGITLTNASNGITLYVGDGSKAGAGANNNEAEITESTTFTGSRGATFTSTLEVGATYTLVNKGADGEQTVMLLKNGVYQETVTYNGNMHGGSKGSTMYSVWNDDYAPGNVLVWNGTNESSSFDVANFIGGNATLANSDLIFASGIDGVTTTVNVSGEVTAGSISIYDNYTFNATAATTLATANGITMTDGKTLTLAAGVGNTGTNTINSAITGGNLEIRSGNWKMGALSSATFNTSIVVSGGVLEYTGASEEQAVLTPKFVSMLNGVSTTGSGLIRVTGDVNFNYQAETADASKVNIEDNIEVTGSLTINSWGSSAGDDEHDMRRWEVNEGGSLTVGGKLWLTNQQKLVVGGGSVIATAGIQLGHTENRGSYESRLEMSSGSVTTSGIIFQGPDNGVDVTGGTLTFRPVSEGGNVLVQSTDSRYSTDHGGTVSIENASLVADSTGWIMDGAALINTTVSIKNVTIAEGNTHGITLKNVNLSGSIVNNAELALGSGVTVAANDSATVTGHKVQILSTLASAGTLNLNADAIYVSETLQGYEMTDGTTAYSLDGTNIVENGVNGFKLNSGATYYLSKDDSVTTTCKEVWRNDTESYTLVSDESGLHFTVGETVRSGEYYITNGDVTVDSAVQALATGYVVQGGNMKITGVSVSNGSISYTSGSITLDSSATITDLIAATDSTLMGNITGAGTMEVAVADNWNDTITTSAGFTGTVYVKSGTKFTYDSAKLGSTLKLASGVNMQVNGGGSLTDNLVLETGSHEVHVNGDTSFDVTGSISGEGTFKKMGGSSTVYIKDNATVANYENNTGTTTVQGGEVTNLTASGGTVNVQGGEVTTLNANSGNSNLTGGNTALLKLAGGTVNVQGGALTDVNYTGSGTLNFKQTNAQQTQYNLGTIASSSANNYQRHLTVDAGVTVKATGLHNNWGMGTITINGDLDIDGELKFSTGSNNSTENNILTGSGTVTANTLTIGNVGKYNFSTVNLTVEGETNMTAATLQITSGTFNYNGKWNGTDGTVNLMGGTINFNYAENPDTASEEINTFNVLDIAGADVSTAQINLADNVKLKVSSNMWLGGSAVINLAEGAELQKGTMAIIGTGNKSTVTDLDTGDSNAFAHDSDDHIVSNASIRMSQDSAATLALKLDKTAVTNTGSGELTVSNSANTITALSAENGNVKLSASMAVDSISAKSGKMVTVTNGNTIAMGGGAVSIGANGADATLTARSNTALAQLQEDASFTIQDMTLTNTTITAATVATKVNLQNVTASNVVLDIGKFSTDAPMSVVGAGGTAFSASTSAITEGGITINASAGASLAVDLGDLSCVTAMGPGKYDLSITLSGVDFYSYENLTAGSGIIFTADSWLGQLLTAQGATAYVSGAVETPASVSEGGSTGGVSVSYSAATGENVGTIITIYGLNVPEPATSTLSLLALAALAARRRRK